MVDVGVTDVGVLDVTALTPLSILAVPPAKTAVKSMASPAVVVSAAVTLSHRRLKEKSIPI